MAERPTVAVKYCGGCNPTYDRVELVSRLRDEFPLYNFVSEAREDEPANAPSADYALAVCGCVCRCADYEWLDGKRGRMVIWRSSDLDKALKALRRTEGEVER
ncbi:MAG: hypothetical protein LBR38_09625 [Synergistaceae bacterium]|jgi:hypothetical protein|nr:hypothetical protein [Synergistaceae bacterium]